MRRHKCQFSPPPATSLLFSFLLATSLPGWFDSVQAHPQPAINTENQISAAIASGQSPLNGPLQDFQANRFHKAYLGFKQLATIDKSTKHAISSLDRILAFTAAGASAYQEYRYNEALSSYRQATRLLALEKGDHARLKAELVCSQGEVLYELERLKESQKFFVEAIELWKADKATYDVLLRSLEGLGACVARENKANLAAPIYEEIAWRDRINYGNLSVPYGWALRILSGVYKDSKQQEKSDICFKRSVWNFRSCNRDRLVAEMLDKSKLSKDELYKRITERALGKLQIAIEPSGLGPAYTGKSVHAPVSSEKVCDNKDSLPVSAGTGANSKNSSNTTSDTTTPTAKSDNLSCQWSKALPWDRPRPVPENPAALVWMDPDSTPRGVVVCMPGFGLHRRSFSALGTNLAHLGYLVLSYDVRGFGSYALLKARDSIDLFSTLDDLEANFKTIHLEHPGLPVFILGESMGGSVALQFTAYHPDLVAGLVASVPSASRYPQWKASTKVALELLTGNAEPIDVQNYIVSRATKDQDLKQNLEKDPDGRFAASPKEFLAFNKFVSRNSACARMIKDTPVLMFQGVRDLLIRPEGTIRLFKQIAGEDKDLILVGKSQHLLFEQGQFDNNTMQDLVDWLDSHLNSKQSSEQAQ